MTTTAKRSSIMVNALRKLWREPRFHAVVWSAAALAAAAVIWAWQAEVDLDTLKSLGLEIIERARQSPFWLFAAIAILPALPVPASPFLILAGVVFAPRFGLAGSVALALLALAINMTWTYWLAAGPGRNAVDKLLRFLELELPALSRGNAVRLTLLLRVTPGIPFFLHNLILGFLRVPFRIYLPISLATTCLFTTGFVVFGESITSGRGKLALLAISLMLTAAVLASILRSHMARKSEQLRQSPEPTADG